jgi:hypothetical protein
LQLCDALEDSAGKSGRSSIKPLGDWAFDLNSKQKLQPESVASIVTGKRVICATAPTRLGLGRCIEGLHLSWLL